MFTISNQERQKLSHVFCSVFFYRMKEQRQKLNIKSTEKEKAKRE
jgi:hypothetical protein